MQPPSFTTQRLHLRPPDVSDVEAYERHFVDYEVIRYLSAAVPWPYPAGGIAQWFESHLLPLQGRDRWMWGLYLQQQPSELIGLIELWRPASPENRGFWLGKRYWGQGLMTEAVLPVMDFAFGALGFETLMFSNALGNERSRRVKEKTGAVLLKTEPAAFVDPRFTERELWQLARADWLARRDR